MTKNGNGAGTGTVIDPKNPPPYPKPGNKVRAADPKSKLSKLNRGVLIKEGKKISLKEGDTKITALTNIEIHLEERRASPKKGREVTFDVDLIDCDGQDLIIAFRAKPIK